MAPQSELTAAARRTVRFLAEQVPLRAWLVALTDDTGGWTPLAVSDRGYGFVEGERLPWQDTVCSRMVQGLGPHAAARVVDVVDYVDLPLVQELPIGAYIGAALLEPGGRLVGTLCGLDPAPQPSALAQHLPLVDVLAELLGRLHRSQARGDEAAVRAASAEAAALHDPLTGALSRLGWTDRLPQSTGLCDRSGCLLALLSLDLDDLKRTNDAEGHLAGDALLRRVVTALAPVLRPSDLLARTGGDEFAVAAVVSDQHGLERLMTRVTMALGAAGVRVSAGGALRAPYQPVEQAWAVADARMYVVKQSRRAVAAQEDGTRST